MADLVEDSDENGAAKTLDISKYVRDPQKVLSSLVKTKDRQVIPKVHCRIHVPTRFMENAVGLGGLGVNNFVYGFFALLLDDNTYAVMNVVGMINVNPSMVTKVIVDDTEYYELHFDPAQVMIETLDIVKRETMIFYVVKEMILMGNVPWYAGYHDIAKLFMTAKEYAGSNVGKSPEVVEFLTSLIARPKGDRETLLRQTVKGYSDVDKKKIEYIPLRSVFYAIDSTLNKLAGSYFKQGLVSALVRPANKVEKIERLLRS